MALRANGRGTVPKPNFISDSDWAIVVNVSRDYGQDPFLIAAIGWHETQWGRLGAGRKGYHLGYGVYPGSPFWPPDKPRASQVRGVYNQVRLVARMLQRGFKYPVTERSCIDFAENFYKPGVPEGWGRSVYRIYTRLKGGTYTPTAPAKTATTDNNPPPTITVGEALRLIISTIQSVINLLRRGI